MTEQVSDHWRDGHPTMGLISLCASMTIGEWARFIIHMRECPQCGSAWKAITGQDFPPPEPIAITAGPAKN